MVDNTHAVSNTSYEIVGTDLTTNQKVQMSVYASNSFEAKKYASIRNPAIDICIVYPTKFEVEEDFDFI